MKVRVVGADDSPGIAVSSVATGEHQAVLRRPRNDPRVVRPFSAPRSLLDERLDKVPSERLSTSGIGDPLKLLGDELLHGVSGRHWRVPGRSFLALPHSHFVVDPHDLAFHGSTIVSFQMPSGARQSASIGW
jgi:hypothetical protein